MDNLVRTSSNEPQHITRGFISEKQEELGKILSDNNLTDDAWVYQEKKIDFSALPESVIKDEIKLYIHHLTEKSYSASTITQSLSVFKNIPVFFHLYFPKNTSLSELPSNKGELTWRTFLTNRGKKIHGNNLSSFRQLLKFIQDFYDHRDETEKDVWDVRKINGVYFNKSTTEYLIKFTGIPEDFREEVKYFIKETMFTRSVRNLRNKIPKLEFFLQWFVQSYRKQKTLENLTRNETEKFLSHLYTQKNILTAHSFNDYLTSVQQFIDFLQRREHPKAPIKDVKFLFFPEDYRKRNKKTGDTVRHIPEQVLHQLKEVLNKEPLQLSPSMSVNDMKMVPIVMLLIETGFRAADVLNLKYDTCLLKNNNAYYLQGDIHKTQTKNHRIPIDESTAKLLFMLIENAKSKTYNKEKWLFPAWSSKRRGLPVDFQFLYNALNRWANDYNILDENGDIYKFSNHQFRHTKAVELINSGMNLIHVQKWMAHASPEMTLVYAKILDNTMREEWLQAKEKSVVDENVVKVNLKDGSIDDMTDEDLIEWEYVRHNLEAAKVPMGFCMASKRMQCPFVETPCLTCSNFCTTPEMLPEFENEIEQTKTLIEKTKDMPIWNEKNERYLDRLTHISNTLKEGKIHHELGKSAREFPKSS